MTHLHFYLYRGRESKLKRKLLPFTARRRSYLGASLAKVCCYCLPNTLWCVVVCVLVTVMTLSPWNRCPYQMSFSYWQRKSIWQWVVAQQHTVPIHKSFTINLKNNNNRIIALTVADFGNARGWKVFFMRGGSCFSKPQRTLLWRHTLAAFPP